MLYILQPNRWAECFLCQWIVAAAGQCLVNWHNHYEEQTVQRFDVFAGPIGRSSEQKFLGKNLLESFTMINKQDSKLHNVDIVYSQSPFRHAT